MKTCKHYSEYESQERCKAKQANCTCSGSELQCNYLEYYNAPMDLVLTLRRKDSIDRGTAQVEPYLGR